MATSQTGNDCFTPPPGVYEYGSGPSGRLSAEGAVRRYLADNRDEAGNLVVLGFDQIAVGFTARGCFHRHGLAVATDLPESHIRVFRVAHPQRAVNRVHKALTRGLRTGTLPDIARYDIDSWGPGVLGTEEVSMSGEGTTDELKKSLASALTHGDTTWFTVTRQEQRARVGG